MTFEFDKSGVIVNRGRVQIDGKPVDQHAIFYGESKISGKIEDRASRCVLPQASSVSSRA